MPLSYHCNSNINRKSQMPLSKLQVFIIWHKIYRIIHPVSLSIIAQGKIENSCEAQTENYIIQEICLASLRPPFTHVMDFFICTSQPLKFLHSVSIHHLYTPSLCIKTCLKSIMKCSLDIATYPTLPLPNNSPPTCILQAFVSRPV